MKRMILLLIMTLIFINNIKAQSSMAKSLLIGNKWVYHVIDNIYGEYNVYQEVIGDTIINQKTYAIIQWLQSSYISYKYQRADSNIIYEYVPEQPYVGNTAGEKILTDFRLNIGDSLFSYLIKDKSTIYDYGENRIQIHMDLEQVSLIYDDIYYLKGIGVTNEDYGGHALAGEDIKSELNAVIIDNKMYGDTVLLDVKKSENILPTNFSLYQNYPNPFNPITTIKYSIPHSTFVSIKVYDILGREVEKLVNEVKLPGYYKIIFDGSKLTSGIYFYNMHAGKFSETKKLLIIK